MGLVVPSIFVYIKQACFFAFQTRYNGYIEYYVESYFNANSIDDLEKLNEEIEIEVCDTRDEFEALLKAKFESHTFVYWRFLNVCY